MTNPNPTNETQDRIEAALREVVGLGRLWARTGLDVARRSLEASSTSIAAAAKLLDEVSRSLDEAPAPEAAEPSA